MSLKKQKKFVRNMLRLFFLCLVGAGIFLAVSLLSSIRPPEGNETLNLSGHANGDISAIADAGSDGPAENQVYTFLVAGKDKVADNTDTIMLVKLDISGKSANILNIPRDTMLDTDRKIKKINSSYQIGGIELLEKDIAGITGFYVNRYVLFNIEGVEKIINAIGGVDFDVPQNMNYEDPTQNLSIHLKKGFQPLNGRQAVGLARYRSGYKDGDIGRINVQQELIKALASQALNPENILKLPELVRIISENVETDIDFGNMLWLANQAKEISLSAVETDTLPGVATTIDGLSYWLPYKNELADLVNDKFNPIDRPVMAEDLSIVVYPENKGK